MAIIWLRWAFWGTIEIALIVGTYFTYHYCEKNYDENGDKIEDKEEEGTTKMGDKEQEGTIMD